MPHDANGKALKVGDTVNVPCTVIGLAPGEDYCNVTLESVHPLHPGTHKSRFAVLNARQTVLVGPAAAADPDPPARAA